jgi:mono/diheme cytochrome c family protein
MRTVWPVLAGLWLLLAQGPLGADPAASRVGRSIYRDGLLASGQPLRATVQKGVALNGEAAACVNCHRRSGMGGSEGQSNVRPIAGRLLTSSSQAALARRWPGFVGAAAERPAYTVDSLARALREGLDATGRPLDALMPRYALSDEEVAELHTYLEGLSSTKAWGVSEREIHFSTIIAPGVHPDRRRAMLDVLHAFFRDKNGGTRKESRRRDAGHEQMYLAYRTWVLHVWELEGAPETWGDQLEARYRERPVFAVIGGLGSGTWQPVHAFCERAGLPCVFPDVDYPVLEGAGYQSLYFSRGMALEGGVLARRLAQVRPGLGRIVQVFRDDEQGRVPARALRDALHHAGIEDLDDFPVSGSGALPVGFWSGILRDARPAVLVVWLDRADVQGLGGTGAPPAGVQMVYLSASLSGTPNPGLPEGWLDRVHMVWLFDLPGNRERHLARMNAWLRARQVPSADARTQANAFFAATITGEAISYIGENFSRDYFIERIEQMAGSSLAGSIYPRLSLGPGQRFASRGGYILGFPRKAPGKAVPISDWLIP